MKRAGKKTSALVDAILAAGLPAGTPRAATTVKSGTTNDVSIIQLIANPERYDGKRVQVIGFLGVEFEGTAIYLHREDHEGCITRNSLWVNLPIRMTKEQAEAVNGQYVICIGTFDAEHHGHMGLFSGAIKDVARLQLWTTRAALDRMSPRHGQSGK